MSPSYSTNKHERWPRLALLFLAIQALVLMRNAGAPFFSLYWYCDFAPTLFALSFFLGNTQAIKGLLSIGFFAQLVYLVVVTVKILFGVTLFNFIFDFPLVPQYVVPTMVIHLATLIAFSTTYKIKPTGDALWYALGILFCIFGAITMFSYPTGDVYSNFNYIFRSNVFSFIPWYNQAWIGIVFVFIVIPSHVFQYLVYRIYESSYLKSAK